MDGMTLNGSIESSPRMIVAKVAAYVGTAVGRWVDVMVRVCRNFIDCSSFLAKIENKVIS